MVIRSYVGNHNVVVYKGSTFDPTIRKYKGGVPAYTIPFSGKMLSAKVKQETAEPIILDEVAIPTSTPQIFYDVEPVPDDCDFAIVSAMYVAACKALGMDTSKLLTIGGTVVSDDGQILGCVGFNRN